MPSLNKYTGQWPCWMRVTNRKWNLHENRENISMFNIGRFVAKNSTTLQRSKCEVISESSKNCIYSVIVMNRLLLIITVKNSTIHQSIALHSWQVCEYVTKWRYSSRERSQQPVRCGSIAWDRGHLAPDSLVACSQIQKPEQFSSDLTCPTSLLLYVKFPLSFCTVPCK